MECNAICRDAEDRSLYENQGGENPEKGGNGHPNPGAELGR